MNHAAASRDDISKFVVHLTRHHDGVSARTNLVSILNEKVIEARNAHCLFKYELGRFTNRLASRFNTVCFTETPLTQIRRLINPVPGRRIQLKPFGLVFGKNTLIEQGGRPAIYINTNGTQLRDYLLQQFREHFSGIRSLYRFQRKQRLLHETIIQYYSLVNIIRSGHDFTWEREWHFQGDFKFRYVDLVAILAPYPDDFKDVCATELSTTKRRFIKRVPIISPDWSYEDIVEAMSIQVWNNARAEPVPQA